MKRLNWFFAPLRLPFKLPEIQAPYYIKSFLYGAIRLAIAVFLGPEMYYLVRLRIPIAIAVFAIKVCFALAGKNDVGVKWMMYLAIVSECVQIPYSLYMGYKQSMVQEEVELVEEVDLLDAKGNIIKTVVRNIDPFKL